MRPLLLFVSIVRIDSMMLLCLSFTSVAASGVTLPPSVLRLPASAPFADASMASSPASALSATSVRLEWLTTINDNNAFETLSTIISALALQHAACNLTWQPAGPARGKSHVANITDHFRQHQWRCGRPVNVSLLSLSSASHRLVVSAGQFCFSRLDRYSQSPPSAPQGCFADSREVHSFHFHSGRAREAYLAVRSLQRAAFRWFAVPAPAAPARPQALLLQRWPSSRVVVNEDEVLATLRAADFDARAFTPERVPLTEVLALMRRSSLLVCVHGAGMINQIFMPLGRAAVVEAFLPSQGYNTGPQLSRSLDFQHLKLFLRWEDVDDAPIRSPAVFNRSAFKKWKWTQASLRTWIARCAAEGKAAPNLFRMMTGMCSGLKKTLDYAVNTVHVAYLAATARAFLQGPTAPAAPTTIERWSTEAPPAAAVAAAGAGCAGSVNSVSVGPTFLDGVGVVDASGKALAARTLLPRTLKSLGFCVAPAGAPAKLRLRLLDGEGAAAAADALPVSPTTVLIDIVDPRAAAAGATAVRPSAAHRQSLHYFCEAHGMWTCTVPQAYLQMLLRWAIFYLLFPHAAPDGGMLSSNTLATFLYRRRFTFADASMAAENATRERSSTRRQLPQEQFSRRHTGLTSHSLASVSGGDCASGLGSVSLVYQASRAPCIAGRSFGCTTSNGRLAVWVKNCRGQFQCAGRNTTTQFDLAVRPETLDLPPDPRESVQCGYPPDGRASYLCTCDRSNEGRFGLRPKGKLRSGLDTRQRRAMVAGSMPTEHVRGLRRDQRVLF